MLTKEQKEERRKGIGGSDAAAVLGLSHYKTPLDIYLDKLGLSEESPTNIYMELGDYLEPFVMSKYAQRIEIPLFKPQDPCIHKDYPWMRCNLDFESDDKNIVGEIKVTRMFNAEWGAQYTDEFPTPYLIQCAHNCIVSESYYNKSYDTFPLVVLGQGSEIREYAYRRNSSLEKKIIAAEKQFWQEHVEKQIPPEAMTREDAVRSYQEVNNDSIVADDKLVELYQSFNDLKVDMSSLKEKQDAIKLELYKALGNHTIVINEEGKKIISWKPQERNALNVELFKKEHPDLYQKYSTTSTTRVLRVI